MKTFKISLFFFSLFLIGVNSAHSMTKATVQNIVIKEASQSIVPPALALAVARIESNFNPKAHSSAGARGVMQIMPATARGEFNVGASRLWDARLNVQLGVRYLEQLYKQYNGRWDLALSHYNGGTVKGNKPHSYTRKYVADVMKWKRHYSSKLPQRQVQYASRHRFDNQRERKINRIRSDVRRQMKRDLEFSKTLSSRRYNDDMPDVRITKRRAFNVRSNFVRYQRTKFLESRDYFFDEGY